MNTSLEEKFFRQAFEKENKNSGWLLEPGIRIHEKGPHQILTAACYRQAPTGDREEQFLKIQKLSETREALQNRKNSGALQELAVLYALQNQKHVVRYKDWQALVRMDENGLPSGSYLVLEMELLEDFSEHLEENYEVDTEDDWETTIVPAPEICRIGIHICEALLEAESVRPGICHRDIKYDNLFYDEKENIYKLGDWDSAWIPGQKTAGICGGTVPYMAPELFYTTQKLRADHSESFTYPWVKRSDCIGWQTPDVRADLYSLGIVLFKLCSDGTSPFMDEISGNDRETLLSKAYQKQMSPGKRIPLDGVLQEHCELLKPIIRRATAYYPEDRYQNAAEMKQELELLLYQLDPSCRPKKTISTAFPFAAEAVTAAARRTETRRYSIVWNQQTTSWSVTVRSKEHSIWGMLAVGTDSAAEARYRALLARTSGHPAGRQIVRSSVHELYFTLSEGVFEYHFCADDGATPAKAVLILFDEYGQQICCEKK